MSANATKPRKRFVGRKTVNTSLLSASGFHYSPLQQIPSDILDDKELNAAIKTLPSNYSFEIHKTIHHIRKNDCRMVGLQMPEGLQMFACILADVVERFTSALTVILGDVTYGACCVDDYTASALGCDLLVHYGHSCLVPIDTTTIKTLYVFVEISVDSSHLANTIRLNFPDDSMLFKKRLLLSETVSKKLPAGTLIGSTQRLTISASDSNYTPDQDLDSLRLSRTSSSPNPTHLALVSTIQFAAALQKLKEDLSMDVSFGTDVPDNCFTGKYETSIPRSKPLSPGEILGCTAPKLSGDVDALIYLGDGRFHLEAIMIANPTIPAFRYDPYSKKLTREYYDHGLMRRTRNDAVQSARASIKNNELEKSSSLGHGTTEGPVWGIILGTLGRQGNLGHIKNISQHLHTLPSPPSIATILLSELSPQKLSLFNPHISAFIQTSCPRLSIDWGYAFDRPLLSPYECAVALGEMQGWGDNFNEESKDYKMDFYEAGSRWAETRFRVSSKAK